MPNNWTKCKLGDVVDKASTGLDAIRRAPIVPNNTGIKCLRIQDVSQNKPISNWGYCNVSTNDYNKFKLLKEDILIARTGASVGVNMLVEEDIPSVFNNGLIRIKCSKKTISKYIHYSLQSDYFKNHIYGIAFGTVAQPNIQIRDLLGFKINLPPLDEQKRIAGVLGAFDDKIELLQKQNKTLEDMAKAIFKSWFVDFDIVKAKQRGEDKQKILSTYKITEELYNLFPSSFTDAPASSSFGPIPTGWEVKPLSSIATYLNGLALQKYPIKSGEQGLPAIKIAELRNGISSSTDIVSFDVPKEYIINTGDILFSWSGSLMIKIWTEGTGALNQHLFKVSSGKYPKWFFYLWTEYHMPEFVDIAADKATTMGHIQRKHLDNAMAYIPNGQLIKAADFFIAPILEKQINNAVEIQTLTELRDGLLPRLLSGKLKV